MILTEEQRITLGEASRPLIKWLNENCHPHVVAIVTPGYVELSEGVARISIEDYIPD